MDSQEKAKHRDLTRRSFIGASAAATTALIAGCASEQQLSETSNTDTMPYRVDAELDEERGGTWKPVVCWHSCGGGCLIKAHVVDGIVTRVKTDDNEPDTVERFQNRACPRGRSQRMQVFGADRMKYPMKRKNWQPGGQNVNGELRGIDEWERITWDEALDIVVAETNRIRETYGPNSVFHYSFGLDTMPNLLKALGGYTTAHGVASYGSFATTGSQIGIKSDRFESGSCGSNDRLDLLNADYIVLEGMNPAWASSGGPSLHLWRAKQAGAQFVFIGPEYNVSASMLEAKWIPVRPGTDTAFLLAVAYEMLRLDEEQGNIIDWDFLDRCTVGFDADHMPQDAKLDENFHDYVMGAYDGIPKTPEWATEICGAPVEDITWYAQTLSKDNKVMIMYAYAGARNHSAESYPQMGITIGAMGGHMGKSGHSCSPAYHYWVANDGPSIVKMGDMRGGEEEPNAVDDSLMFNYLWKSINDGHYTLDVHDENGGHLEERDIDIRMIISTHGNLITSMPDTLEAIRAYRKVDFALSFSQNFTPPSQYSDIVLPATTPWEGPGYEQGYLFSNIFGMKTMFTNRETQFFNSYIMPPLYEARSDRDVVYELYQRFGLDADKYFPYSEEQRRMDRILGATVVEADGVTQSPLVTVTQEDLDELGVEGEPQEGKISYKELMNRGSYQVERHEGDNYGYIAYEDFVADPEANPLDTASGKIEIYCQAKADSINATRFCDEEIKPYPAYRVGRDGYQSLFTDWANKEKGSYPFRYISPTTSSALIRRSILTGGFAMPLRIPCGSARLMPRSEG